MTSPPAFERLTRDQVRDRQLSHLHELLFAIDGHNPFWTNRLKEAGVSCRDIKSLDDLSLLPFSVKQDFVDDQQAHPPFGTNLTYPSTQYNRLHQTSGTTGRPLRWLDTPHTWEWWMSCWEQNYRLLGIVPHDVFAFPFSFGPFVGFWAAFEGAHQLGHLCLPMGGMSSEARIRMIVELEATVVCCTPTYALRLADVAQQEGLDLSNSAVRMLIVAGEPGGALPAIRDRIESAWGARVFDHWGMTDVGPLGIEAHESRGQMYLLETESIAEIVDPQTGKPVTRGEPGELVITNLGRWGQPVIRYRTGDLVREATETPPEGPPFMLLDGGIIGRVDDMLTIRGINVFPSSIEAILREFDWITEFRITVETRRSMPHLRIEVEPTPDVDANHDQLDILVQKVGRTIKDRMNFQVEVQTVPPNALPRFEMKGRRFIRAQR